MAYYTPCEILSWVLGFERYHRCIFLKVIQCMNSLQKVKMCFYVFLVPAYNTSYVIEIK